MTNFYLVRLYEHPSLIDSIATWFHEKWQVPKERYLESMKNCINQPDAVPQWYVVMEENEIVGGCGVIENDFHNRKDLAPNLCALYVEPKYRSKGIAFELLRFTCKEMQAMGRLPLYLITDHTSFYEQYGWEFFDMVQGDGESQMSRIYIYQGE